MVLMIRKKELLNDEEKILVIGILGLKKELEKTYNISCSIDLYPNDWKPVYEEYKKKLKKMN